MTNYCTAAVRFGQRVTDVNFSPWEGHTVEPLYDELEATMVNDQFSTQTWDAANDMARRYDDVEWDLISKVLRDGLR